ncbi:exodeoxyribonuclease III [Candidatus Woesearchaeota archaeon]|nr:exodeoxyribonuclease III [Candidatus Woesearchaeota archaeon]
MKIATWNVNGLRAVLQKGFLDFIKNYDVVCVQETKASQDQVDARFEGFYSYWNSADKKGYSGTLILSRVEPLAVVYDIGIEEHDSEGRVITLEFDKFFLVNVYVPNSQRGLLRLDYRQKWDSDFLKFLKSLEEQKPVLFCGDLNVAHNDIDLANPSSNHKNAGFTDEERRGFSEFMNSGFVDVFRYFNPTLTGAYTWWSYMFNARVKNVGWRIDYFCSSESFVSKVKSIKILSSVMGSDHCPVELEIK